MGGEINTNKKLMEHEKERGKEWSGVSLIPCVPQLIIGGPFHTGCPVACDVYVRLSPGEPVAGSTKDKLSV